MSAKVDTPEQNNHKFWGTLVNDNGEKSYFVKLSCDAHFVSNGTVVETGKQFTASEAKEALIKELTENNLTYIPDTFPEGTYFEIVSIDREKTSALTKELNDKTEALFKDDVWLASHPEIGVDAIKIGCALPYLSKVQPVVS